MTEKEFQDKQIKLYLNTKLEEFCVNNCDIVCKVKDRINKDNCTIKNFIKFLTQELNE